jgi:hypothetical protein
MSEKALILYIGEDEAYFKALESEFQKLAPGAVGFKKIFETTEPKIQSLFLKVIELQPICILVDFSKLPQEFLHLARLISRTNTLQSVLTVGLLDNLTSNEIIAESLVTGMKLIHFKGPDVYDVVFDITKLILPEKSSEHGFATAALSEDWEAGILCKIGFVENECVHFETDFPLEVGGNLRLAHMWQEKKIIPSRQIQVTSVTEENLYYQFRYGVGAKFKFIDELVHDEDTKEEDAEDREKDRQELIRRSKKQFKSWIEDNQSSSQEKIAKVLVIDRDFHFYQDQKRTDKYSYLIRCQPFLEAAEVTSELKRVAPQVIAISLEEVEVPAPRSDFTFLEQLIESIKAFPKERWPFLVIFNTSLPSGALQKQLNYEHIMSASNELSVEVLLKMACLFENKLLKKREMLSASKDPRVYLKKSNAASVGEILNPIKVTKLSETDLVFQSEIQFQPGTNLRFKKPIPMVIHVLPGKDKEYYGLIHCLGEAQKKELRKYVNSIFFRDHDAKVSSEADEFRKLNEAKLQEKVEQEKKAQEESAKEDEESTSSE